MKHILNLLLLPVCCFFLAISATKANPVIPPFTSPPDDDLLSLTLSVETDLLCHGDNNGLAVVVALGGLPPYVYVWSNGGIGPINANLSAGVYTATVTDLLGATATLNVTIDEPAQLLVNVATQVDINCLNVNGSATVNSTGGTGSALYVWSNGQVGPTATNLAAGLYTVTATDANGCTSLKAVNVTANVQLPTVNVNLAADLQVDCGSPLVSLDASASTGGPNLAYLWTTVNGHIAAGATSNIASVDAAGTYLLKVTNNDNGCTSTQAVNVTADITLPTVNIAAGANVDLQLDFLSPQITLDASASTGGAGITYLWTTVNGHIVSGANTTSPTVDQPGVYVLLVTNTNTGCTGTQTVTVTADLTLPIANINIGANVDLQLDCLTPQITLDAAASTSGPGITYLWTTVNGHIVSGANSTSPTVDQPGVYLLLVTNTNNGGTSTQTVTVTADISLPIAGINIGANVDLQLDCLSPQITLDAAASASGPGITYLWTTVNGHILSGNNTTHPVVDGAGVYVLLVTNTNTGCTNTATATVTADVSLPTVAINVGANVDLQLDCLTPQITLDAAASAGGPGITYLWTTVDGHILSGNNTTHPVVDGAGVYVLLVTNIGTGCTNTATATVTADVSLPTVGINVGANVDLQLDCLTPQLTLDAAASAAGPGITYLWTTVNGHILSGNTTTHPVVDGVGVYVLLVTNTNTGCNNTASVTVTADASLPIASINVGANVDLQLDFLTPQITLDASASASGPGITYLWTTVNGHIVSGANSTSPTVDQPGVYVLLVTNTNTGCTSTQPVTVTIDITLPIADINIGGSVDLQLDCTSPLITLDASASTSGPGITYLWTTVNGHIVSGANSTSPMVDQPGVYVLLVTNTNNGGTSTQTATVTADISLPIAAINAGANVDLQLDCTSPQITLDATASAAAPGITYLWTTVNGHIVSGNSTTSPIVDAAGVYVLLVTNTNTGCTNTASVTITADASLPIASIAIGANVDLQLDCLSPQVTLDATASASGAGITYLWTTVNGHIVSGANSNLATVDAAGNYVLVVSNSNTGCSATTSVTVTADISLPTATIDLGVNVDLQLDCTSSQITISGQGSASGSGIVYLWTTVNGHIVSGANTLSVVVDAAGDYTLQVTNSTTGCSNTASVTVTGNVALPTVTIDAAVNVDLQIDCTTPQITLSGQGSATGANIVYLWTTVNGHIVSGNNTLSAVVDAAGTYTLQVTNSSTGCSGTASVTVTADVNLPVATIAIGANVDLQIDCVSPQITLNASASSSGSGITYLWTTVNGHIVGAANTTSLTVDAAGTYVLQVTNASGCSVSASVDVTANATLPTVSATVTGQLGCSASSLTIDASASSQGSNYSYIWSTINGNIITGANTLSPTVNAAGTYTLLVTNESTGCTATTSVVVTGTPTLNVSVTGMISVSCFGLQNGSATLNVTGGAAPYTYLWSNGMTTASISGLAAGVYIATVTDANGCQSVLNVTISQPAQLSATATTTSATTGQSNGTATINATGGTAPYTYNWSNGMTGSSVTGLVNATYTVVVSDAQGCSTTITVVVGGNDPACALTIAVNVLPTACGQATGQANVMAINGTGTLTYLWSNGMTTAQVLGLAAGVYTVVVTDAQGCTASTTATIVGNNDSTPPTVITQNATIFLNASGQATLTPSMINNGSSDACGPITLVVNTDVFDCGDLGTHVVVLTVTDQSGNTSTGTANVTVVDNIAPTLTCPTNITINGGSPVVTYTPPTMTDNCANAAPGTVVLVGGLASGSVFPAGTTTVTYVAATPGSAMSTCTFTVTVNPTSTLTVNIDVIAPSCPGSTNGSATVNVTGGTPPYQYLWVESGQTTPTATGLGAGTYKVVVVDAQGIVIVHTVTVTDPTPLNVNIAIVTNDCNGTGSIDVTVTGGTAPYTYAWYDINGNVFATTEDLGTIPSGTYVLVVTDASGCSFTTGPIIVDFVTGTTETELSTFGTVALAPNPVDNGPVVLSLNLPESSPIRVETYNMSGQLVGNIQEGEFQKGQFTLHFGTFAPGQYLVKVITDNHTYLKKVIRIQ